MQRGSSERRGGKSAVWVIAAVTLLVAGAVIGQYLLPSTAPSALGAAAAETSFDVEEVSFDDARTVQLSLDISEDWKLIFPLEGRVIQTACVVGAPISSGQTIAELSGKRVLALSTRIPLWESMQPGEDGEDVDALRQEMIRLGITNLADTGPVNSAVLSGLAELFAVEGESPEVLEEVPADQIMWIPQPTVTMLKCAAKVADTAKDGDEFGTVSGSLVAAHVAPMPTDLIPGARTLKTSGVDVPVEESGAVSSPEALASIAASAEYQAMRSAAGSDGLDETKTAAPTMAALFALTPQTTAWAVPASTVFEVVGNAGCITSKGESLAVSIVGSRLGKTYVVPADETAVMPPSIDAPGLKPPSCVAAQ